MHCMNNNTLITLFPIFNTEICQECPVVHTTNIPTVSDRWPLEQDIGCGICCLEEANEFELHDLAISSRSLHVVRPDHQT